jgi:formate-dependent nitrite reductase cytochrome c552 subunit
LSKHYTGTTSARNTKYCARCHTAEGFQEVLGAPGKTATSNDIPNATRINCATCHAHSAFDFAGDTAAMILTTTAPVKLIYNNTPTDFGKINNLCTNCHQIRGVTSVNYTDATVTPSVVKTFNQLPFFPLDNTKENTTVKYQVGQSFSVHDGNQTNLFAGINGYEYAGQTYTRTWTHSSFTCTDCHMNEYNATDKRGGHTLLPNEAACTKCHSGADKITPVQALIDAKRIELGELLTARKVFKKTTNSSGVVSYSAVQTHDFLGTLFATEVSTTTYAKLTGANTVSPTTGLVIYANTVTMATDPDFALRIGREWKYGELGAAYNYAYINSELSKGVHNPVYALQILQKSIDWLKIN